MKLSKSALTALKVEHANENKVLSVFATWRINLASFCHRWRTIARERSRTSAAFPYNPAHRAHPLVTQPYCHHWPRSP